MVLGSRIKMCKSMRLSSPLLAIARDAERHSKAR